MIALIKRVTLIRNNYAVRSLLYEVNCIAGVNVLSNGSICAFQAIPSIDRCLNKSTSESPICRFISSDHVSWAG